MCFVQTTELDGERNLKPVIASKYLDFYFKRIFVERDMKLKAHFVKPDKDMYFYDGRIELSKQSKSDREKMKNKVVKIDLKMFLHRGAVLRNSGSVYALVT